MPLTLKQTCARSKGTFLELMGIVFDQLEFGKATAHINIQATHLAPNGYLHAASVVGLADSSCGYGALASLPEGATGFTTIELKSNFLGTAREGTIVSCAKLHHGGRKTQVWDAVVTDQASGKTIALFRCTQMVLYPKS